MSGTPARSIRTRGGAFAGLLVAFAVMAVFLRATGGARPFPAGCEHLGPAAPAHPYPMEIDAPTLVAMRTKNVKFTFDVRPVDTRGLTVERLAVPGGEPPPEVTLPPTEVSSIAWVVRTAAHTRLVITQASTGGVVDQAWVESQARTSSNCLRSSLVAIEGHRRGWLAQDATHSTLTWVDHGRMLSIQAETPTRLVFPSADGKPMRRSNFRRRVWEPATVEAGMSGLRFHDLRHTAATLAAASGASLKALMARIGHASARAALRYQHVIDGQDADIVRYLERFGEEPPMPSPAHDDREVTGAGGHAVGTPGDSSEVTAEESVTDAATDASLQPERVVECRGSQGPQASRRSHEGAPRF